MGLVFWLGVLRDRPVLVRVVDVHIGDVVDIHIGDIHIGAVDIHIGVIIVVPVGVAVHIGVIVVLIALAFAFSRDIHILLMDLLGLLDLGIGLLSHLGSESRLELAR